MEAQRLRDFETLSHRNQGNNCFGFGVIFCQLDARVPAARVPESRSGLSRRTVQRGLAPLQATGWVPALTPTR